MKKRLRRIIIAAVLFVCALAGELLLSDLTYGKWARFALYTAAYLVIGGSVLIRAAKNIARGQIFDENFLMTIATVGAYIIGEYMEAVAVMLFYQVGELFERYAVGKSRKSIAELMNIRPDHASLLRADGTTAAVDPSEVKPGDTIVIMAGERIPLDGVVTMGESSVDTSALTGESIPRDVVCGDDVLSGCINMTGLLHVRVTKEYGESTAAKILELVENASSKKSKSENFITRFAAYYTPAVVISAALLAIVPPLIIKEAAFADWIYRALNFLIVSCPCALVISVPLSFFGGIGGASKRGILIKGSNYLEALADAEIAVFDKTGTLTKGKFEVTEIHGEREDELLALAAMAEKYSNHPISQSICRAYTSRIPEDVRKTWENLSCTDVKELAGHGVQAVIDGHTVFLGNARLMQSIGIGDCMDREGRTVIHIASDGEYLGCISLEDTVKPDAETAIKRLKENGVRKIVMLTGDSEEVGRRVAEKLGLDGYHAKLLPADKVDAVEKLLPERSEKGKLVFIGDGMNDAPVLARADIGVAMGGLGQDAAIEAADVVIMTDEPSKLADAIAISKKTLRIVRQNIVFALGVKAIVLLLSAWGHTGMWAAVFADVGVSVVAILNSMRCGSGEFPA